MMRISPSEAMDFTTEPCSMDNEKKLFFYLVPPMAMVAFFPANKKLCLVKPFL